MRVTILGLPGSGKSTLARKISEKLNIPYIHIDRFWLEAGGGHNSKTTPDPEKAHANVREKVLEAIQAESWVSDGVYRLVQPEIANRADAVVFLDIPLWERLLNHAARTIHRKSRHDEMTFWGDMSFFLEIVSRDLRKKGKIQSLVESYKSKAIILKSRKAIANYLGTL
ncbi:MAG: DNA topology modulation protein [Parcubacteria bacterium C7867-007]|nr:MAG: DNA topology modulation protein [Parcubacteria bacterium C7867-007]